MKIKNIIAVICICGLLAGSAFALEETTSPEKNNKKAEKVAEKNRKKAEKAAKKNKNNAQQTVEYTNDVHSIFTLDDCINIAIENNPDIRASIFNEEAYKSQILQAWANYFPSISAGVDISHNETKYSEIRNKQMPYLNTYTTMGYLPNVSADMLIFDFGKTKATADMASNLYQASKEDTKENINSIIYSIKSTYYNILFAQAQVRVYEDTVKDYELQLTQAQSFYKLGKKAKLDVVTAEYNLGKAQLNLVKAKNVLEVVQVLLSKIMGIPEYTNYELADSMMLNRYDITQDDAIKTAMEVRPELNSAIKTTKAAKMKLRAARREFAPDLGIFGSYGNGIGNDYNVSSTQFGAGLSYSNLNILRTKKMVDQARAEYNKTQALLESTKDTVYYNVKKAYIDLQTNKEAVVIAKLALDQAKEQYRQVTGRYKAGVGDIIELKDGENTYLNARLDFYNALLNYNVTAASLEKEIGIPLKHSDESIITLSPEDI